MLKEKSGFMGANDNSLIVTYTSEANGESSFVLGRLEERDTILAHLKELCMKASPAKNDEATVN